MKTGRMPARLWKKADAISGWLTRAEGDLLWRLCEPPWCEVGSWCGRSAVILAAKGPGTCIDWCREGNLHAVLRDNVPDTCAVLQEDFREAASHVPSGLQFLHLDADHSYDGTKAAWDLYFPKLEPGGHVVIHDAWVHQTDGNPWPEVTFFVSNLIDLQAKNGVEHVGDVERSAAFRKL